MAADHHHHHHHHHHQESAFRDETTSMFDYGRHPLLPTMTSDGPRHSLTDVYYQQCRLTADCIDPYWDCCGATSVTIESKIEQALDLVKNHLMFAVREEVSALNRELHELVCKNEQLENENRILRSYASPETLSRLHSILRQLNDIQTFAA